MAREVFKIPAARRGLKGKGRRKSELRRQGFKMFIFF